MNSVVYCFANYRVDPARRQIVRAGQFIELPSSAFDCLVYLIQHRERAVGRDELISAVWGRADISENLLSHTMVRIRRALADGSGPYGLVRTVSRFGYHWIAPIRVDSADAADAPVPPVDAPSVIAPLAAATSDAAPLASVDDGPFTLAAAVAPDATDATRGCSESVALTPVPARRDAALALPGRPTWQVGSMRLSWMSLGAGACLFLLLAVALARFAIAPSHVGLPQAGEAGVVSLVVPARVADAANADWMPLGVMEAVSNRLRSARLAVLDSADLLRLPHDAGGAAALTEHAARRIEPTVWRDANGWRVDLDSSDGAREVHVSGAGADAIAAARAAADALSEMLGAHRGPMPALADDGAPVAGADKGPLAHAVSALAR